MSSETDELYERFASKYEVCPETGCWLWQAALGRTGGYGVLRTGSVKDGTRRLTGAHRVSWKLHYEEIPDGLMVLHRCDVPRCVNPGHLFLGTAAENSADKLSKGRLGRAAKLTQADVEYIRSVHAVSLRPHRVTAAIFGVQRATVSRILRGESWVTP